MIALWGFIIERPKKSALETGISLDKTNKAAEDASSEEKGNYMVAEASGVDEEGDEGESAIKVAGMREILLGCPLLEQDGKDEGGTRAQQS